MEPAQHFPRYILFFNALFWCEWMFAKVFNSMQRLLRSTLVHSTVFWYQYELLYSVIGFPQRLSSLHPIPSQEMYCRIRLWGIKLLINGWDKSINNAEIRDTGIVSQTPLQDTSLERVQCKCPVWHHQCLLGLTCHIQQQRIWRCSPLSLPRLQSPSHQLSSHPVSYTWLQLAS